MVIGLHSAAARRGPPGPPAGRNNGSLTDRRIMRAARRSFQSIGSARAHGGQSTRSASSVRQESHVLARRDPALERADHVDLRTRCEGLRDAEMKPPQVVAPTLPAVGGERQPFFRLDRNEPFSGTVGVDLVGAPRRAADALEREVTGPGAALRHQGVADHIVGSDIQVGGVDEIPHRRVRTVRDQLDQIRILRPRRQRGVRFLPGRARSNARGYGRLGVVHEGVLGGRRRYRKAQE